MNKKHSSLMDSFFLRLMVRHDVDLSSYPICYSPVPNRYTAGKVWQSYGKRHKKALGKARKSGAEGESLKLLKESGAIFPPRPL